MARVDIKKGIYAELLAASGLLSALGPVTTANARIYNGFPQVQPALSGTEPAGEGWLIFYEEQAVILFDSIAEDVYVDFHVWCTRLSLGEDALDILDSLYHWKIAGQNSRVYGERNVLNSRRIHALEAYDPDVKLYRKICRYKFVMVKHPFTS